MITQVRDKMIKLAKSGKLQSMPAVQKYLTEFMLFLNIFLSIFNFFQNGLKDRQKIDSY